MARVGIDARLWGTKHTGIGRYVEQLVTNLKEVDKENEYVLFLRKEDFEKIEVPSNWKKVVADIQHYTLKEQVVLPSIFSKEKLDILHVPHYNVPVFYGGKFLITIHDLTWHNFKGTRATTLSWPVYLIKYLAYKWVVKSAIKRAAKIITPSFAVKSELAKRFDIPNNKVEVTYEGVNTNNTQISNVKRTYLLYVGNLYPHKNVETLARALKNMRIELVVVCGRSIFLDRFRKFLFKAKVGDLVEIQSEVSDDELNKLYDGAAAFVFPSLSEGFGLPGLEAMQRGCPVVCSDIPVFREIYKDAAIYFDPKDEKDIREKIESVTENTEVSKDLIQRGFRLVKQYSWRKMAEETLHVYESCASL